MFEHVSGFIQCCGCWFGQLDDSDPFPEFNTPREALAHLDVHENAGHDIGEARERIIEEHHNLDIEIQPYVKTPEQEAAHIAFWKSLNDEQEHPPQKFRDRSNGE
jgi:hypothetical protein